MGVWIFTPISLSFQVFVRGVAESAGDGVSSEAPCLSGMQVYPFITIIFLYFNYVLIIFCFSSSPNVNVIVLVTKI